MPLLFFFTGLAQQPIVRTIYEANGKPAVLTTPDGKSYKIDFWKDPNEKDAGLVATNCNDNHFTGKDRKAAKTTEVDPSKYVSCASLMEMKTKLKLPSDKTMIATLTKTSPRSAIEKNGVILDHVLLFAFKRESDNDYHLIIGDNADINKATLFNMEISGIPTPDNPDLDNARKAFLNAFNLNDKTCMSSYAIFINNPVPVHIEGSVFYDVDHKPGTIGPVNNGVSLRPATSWEIHPISSFSLK
jgi:hypothetical protein